MAFVYWIRLPEHVDPKTQGYVGITSSSVSQRYSSHRNVANKKTSNLPIHCAIRKYGNKLVISTLHEFDIELCQLIEWGYRSVPCIGWNIAIGGDSTTLGRKASEETRAKLRQAAAKRIEQLREQGRTGRLGKRHSEATKQLMRESAIARAASNKQIKESHAIS